MAWMGREERAKHGILGLCVTSNMIWSEFFSWYIWKKKLCFVCDENHFSKCLTNFLARNGSGELRGDLRGAFVAIIINSGRLDLFTWQFVSLFGIGLDNYLCNWASSSLKLAGDNGRCAFNASQMSTWSVSLPVSIRLCWMAYCSKSSSSSNVIWRR